MDTWRDQLLQHSKLMSFILGKRKNIFSGSGCFYTLDDLSLFNDPLDSTWGNKIQAIIDLAGFFYQCVFTKRTVAKHAKVIVAIVSFFSN